MQTAHVEVLVEEPSAEVALRHLLPKILRAVPFEVYPHQCKSELLQRLPDRLRAYYNWLPNAWRIVVLLDRDNDACEELKAKLEKLALRAGLSTRSRRRDGAHVLVNRLAIEELEAWYFGDWEAVRTAYPRVSSTIPRQAKYRDPDAVAGGTWEAFERVLQKAGYFKGGLRKIEAARAIAPHLMPQRNSSRSFQVLREALVEMLPE